MTTAKQAISDKIEAAVISAVSDPNVPAQPAASQPIIDKVKERILPMILSATNNEKWYQSQVTVGSYIAMISTVVGPLVGHQFSQEEQALITSMVTGFGVIFGGALALYGRWKARVPLGH